MFVKRLLGWMVVRKTCRISTWSWVSLKLSHIQVTFLLVHKHYRVHKCFQSGREEEGRRKDAQYT